MAAFETASSRARVLAEAAPLHAFAIGLQGSVTSSYKTGRYHQSLINQAYLFSESLKPQP
jgi:hypothetical protein